MKQNSDNNNCKIYRFENETGQGTITSYEVFPGVLLAYNDFHMSYYDSAFQPRQDVFCIDHCREGRLQYRMNYAAEQLHSDTQISIADLAGGLGYDSQSKFAMAFRKVMGMSPTEYRRQMKNPLP